MLQDEFREKIGKQGTCKSPTEACDSGTTHTTYMGRTQPAQNPSKRPDSIPLTWRYFSKVTTKNEFKRNGNQQQQEVLLVKIQNTQHPHPHISKHDLWSYKEKKSIPQNLFHLRYQ